MNNTSTAFINLSAFTNALLKSQIVFVNVNALWTRAVVKSTFVESKTSPSPKRSSPSQDRVQSGSSPSQVQVQMRRSKQRKKKIIFFKTTYLIIDNWCDTRDGISSILI